MASYATLTINAADIVGADFDRSRANAVIEWGGDDGVIDAIKVDNTEIRLGNRREYPDSTGNIVFANLVTTNSASNPTSFFYRVTITYTPKGSRKQGHDTWTSGWFPLTANANAAAIDAFWDPVASPVTWRSDFRDQMQVIRAAVEADRAFIEARVVDDLGTSDGQASALMDVDASQLAESTNNRIATQAGHLVNVRALGAQGDGLTNDAPAFQQAFDLATANGGGRIVVPGGTYNIGATLLIGSGTHLDLAPDATLLRGGTYNNMIRNNGNGVTGGYGQNSYITLSGGTIDGNASVYTTSCTLVAFGHANNITIRDMRITNLAGSWHCVELCAVQYGKIQGCEFDNSLTSGYTELVQLDLMKDSTVWPWFGPYDDTTCADVVVSGNHFHDSTIAAGIGSHSATAGRAHARITIEGNRFNDLLVAVRPWEWATTRIVNNDMDDVEAGVLWNSTAAGFMSDLTISNNRISLLPALEGRGIHVKAGSGTSTRYYRAITISDNNIRNAGRYGIGVDWGQGVVVANNVITGTGTINDGSSQSRVAIWVYNTAQAVVSGNQIRDTNAGALPASAQADIFVGFTAGGTVDVTVSGNMVTGNMIIDDVARITTTGNIIGGTLTTTGTVTGDGRANNVVGGTLVP